MWTVGGSTDTKMFFNSKHTTCGCWVHAWMLNCRPDLEESSIQSIGLSYLQVFNCKESQRPNPHIVQGPTVHQVPELPYDYVLVFTAIPEANSGTEVVKLRLTGQIQLSTYVFMFYTLRMVLHIFKWSKKQKYFMTIWKWYEIQISVPK